MPRPQFRVWIDPNPDEPLEEMTAEITEDGELRLTSVYDRFELKERGTSGDPVIAATLAHRPRGRYFGDLHIIAKSPAGQALLRARLVSRSDRRRKATVNYVETLLKEQRRRAAGSFTSIG